MPPMPAPKPLCPFKLAVPDSAIAGPDGRSRSADRCCEGQRCAIYAEFRNPETNALVADGCSIQFINVNAHQLAALALMRDSQKKNGG